MFDFQAIGEIGTALAAVVALASFWVTRRKNRADTRETYAAGVRRNITEFDVQRETWMNDYGNGRYFIVAMKALQKALQRDRVPSPATPAFDDYIHRYGKSLCLEVWNTAIQSTSREQSLLRTGVRFDGLFTILSSASQLLNNVERELYSPKLLQDTVIQLAVPERRTVVEEEREGEDRNSTDRDEVLDFVNVVLAGLAHHQDRFKDVVRDVNRCLKIFLRETQRLSDADLYRLSHLSGAVASDIDDSMTHTGDIRVLLTAIRNVGVMDESALGHFAIAIDSIERETDRLAGRSDRGDADAQPAAWEEAGIGNLGD